MTAGTELCARFAASHPEDAARILERSRPQSVAALLESLPRDSAVEVLRRLHTPFAARCLEHLSDAAGEICRRLPLDHAAQLLRRAGHATADRVLRQLPEDDTVRLRRLLRHPEGTAAAIADQQAMTVPSDISIAEARRRVQSSSADVTYDIYVVDRDGRLRGVSDIRRLFRAQARDPVATIMRSDVVRLAASSDLATVALHPGWHDFDALPVVDESGNFLGIVWHRTVRQMAAAAPSDGPSGLDVLSGVANLYWITLADLVAGLGQLAGRAAPVHLSSRS